MANTVSTVLLFVDIANLSQRPQLILTLFLSFQTDIGFIYHSPGRYQLLQIRVSSEKKQASFPNISKSLYVQHMRGDN